MMKKLGVLLLLLAGLALVTVRREVAASASAKSSASSQTVPHNVPGHPHPFSQAYEYCYVDSEGRPMIVHRRLVYLLPAAPPEVNDRTFIESGECH